MVQLAKGRLKGKYFTVDEDIPKDLYELRNAQTHKVKAAKKRGLKAFFNKAQPYRLYINGKFSIQSL